jgi:hypothetical protein
MFSIPERRDPIANGKHGQAWSGPTGLNNRQHTQFHIWSNLPFLLAHQLETA